MIFKIHCNPNFLFFDKAPLEVCVLKNRKRKKKKEEIKKRMESGKKVIKSNFYTNQVDRAEDKKGFSRNINMNRGGICL